MMSLGVSIDVPDLAAGIRFYTEAFGCSPVATPVPGVAVLKLGSTTLCLLEKKEGSKPSPNTQGVRRYQRHWTPVHLDLHVPDLPAARERAVRAGAVVEQTFENPEHGSASFCSDPFGHGFCLIEQK